MTPDYQLLGTLIALCFAGYWLSEKAMQWWQERIYRETVAEARKRTFKLVRPGE